MVFIWFSITSVSVSFQSKWIYLGTKAGNIHVVNIESFKLSGYTIHWNKAIEKYEIQMILYFIISY